MDPWERFGELFNGMKPHIAASDWQGLERHYADMAMQMSWFTPRGTLLKN